MTTHARQAIARLAAFGAAAAALAIVGGCAAALLAGGMAQNFEYQKKIEVPPMYDELEGHNVAVLVDVNMAMMYEHPLLAREIAVGLVHNMDKNLPDARFLSPAVSLDWQYDQSAWSVMPASEIAAALNVERLVIVDLYEYRHTPAGNSWQWDGVAAANVRIYETDADAYDPEMPVDEFNVIARFPEDDAVVKLNTSEDQIQVGLVLKFTQQVAWLFYTHLEPKYPDKYDPELDF